MALGFACSQCGLPIIVKYLRPGDQALCRHCSHTVIVPPDASETDAEPDLSRGAELAERHPAWAAAVAHEAKPVVPSMLGPREFGPLFREIFRLYGKNSATLFIITGLVEIPVFVWGYALGLHSSWLAIRDVVPPSGGLLGLEFTVYVIVAAFLSILLQGALIHAVTQQYMLPKISIRAAFKFALSRLAPLFGAMALSAVLSVVSIFIVLIPIVVLIRLAGGGFAGAGTGIVVGIILMFVVLVRLMFAMHAVMIENAGPAHALSRSWHLTAGSWLRSLALMLLLTLIAGAVSLIGQFIPITGLVTNILVLPMAATGYVVFYYDLRVRKDGYTPDDLARYLGIPEGQVAWRAATASGGELTEADTRPDGALPGAARPPEATTEAETDGQRLATDPPDAPDISAETRN